MVTLQIQKFLDEQNLSVQELSDRVSISTLNIERYISSKTIELDTKVLSDLRQISQVLNVCVLALLTTPNPENGFKLDILERLRDKQISLFELHENTKIDYIALVFYLSLFFFKEDISKNPLSSDLHKICGGLECKPSELLLEVEMQSFKIPIDSIAQKKGISIEVLGLMIGIPIPILNLIRTNPIELRLLEDKIFLEALSQDVSNISKQENMSLDFRGSEPSPSDLSGLKLPRDVLRDLGEWIECCVQHKCKC